MGIHSLGRTSRFTHRYTLAPRDILPLFKSVLVAERQLRARECFHDPSTSVVGNFSYENHTFYLRLERPHYNATFCHLKTLSGGMRESSQETHVRWPSSLSVSR